MTQFGCRALLRLLFLLPAPLLFADDANVEYKIKAGYLYNFTKFVTWSEDDAKTFNVCIWGEDPFGALIEPLETKTALGRPIKLFRFNNGLQHDQHCHILYMNDPGNDRVALKDALVIRDLDNTLTVGESEEFTKQGGMIGFVNRQDKIKIQINVNAFKQSRLTVSAKLLEVAEIVGGTP